MNMKTGKQDTTRCDLGQAVVSISSSLEWTSCSACLMGFWRGMEIDVLCEVESSTQLILLLKGEIFPLLQARGQSPRKGGLGDKGR